jgi:hypothetical protein
VTWGVRQVEWPVTSFAYDAGTGLSTVALPAPASTDAARRGQSILFKSGAMVLRRIDGVPASAGEFTVSASTLSVFGDVTGSGDTYTLVYPLAGSKNLALRLVTRNTLRG